MQVLGIRVGPQAQGIVHPLLRWLRFTHTNLTPTPLMSPVCVCACVLQDLVGSLAKKVRTSPELGSNLWARSLFNKDDDGKLLVVQERGVTRKGQPGDRQVTRITCLICRRNVGYSRGSLRSAIAHLKTHNIHRAEDVTDDLLRLVMQFAADDEPLPPKFHPKPLTTSGMKGSSTRTHTLEDFGVHTTPSATSNTVLARRFKKAAASWVAAAALSYSVTEHPAFHDMCRVLDPNAPKIGRKAITNQVSGEYCSFVILEYFSQGYMYGFIKYA